MKTPWHLWLVGVVSLLWNAVGAFDYTMTVTKNAAYMGQFTPDQLEFFYGFPTWMMASWATAVWGAVLGSILLLFRSGLAALVFAVSLLGMIVSMTYSFALSGVNYAQIVGTGGVLFSAAIALVAVFLWIYARAMRQRGVLG